MDRNKQFWVTCQPCSFSWIVVYLPMDMAIAGKAMKGAICPKCGTGKKLTCATTDEIDRAVAAIRAEFAIT